MSQFNEEVVVSTTTTPLQINFRRSRSPFRNENNENRRRETRSQPENGAVRNADASVRQAESQPSLVGSSTASTSQSFPATIPTPLNYNNLRYEFIPGKRITSKVLHTIDEQQLYAYKVKTKEHVQYNCYKLKETGCEAKVYTKITSGVCFRKSNQTSAHNHATLRKEIDEIKLKTEIKKNAAIRQHCLNISERAAEVMCVAYTSIAWPS